MANNLINGDSFDFAEGMKKNEIEQAIANANDVTQIWHGRGAVGDTLTLSEPFTNFRQLLLWNGDQENATVSVGSPKGFGPYMDARSGTSVQVNLTGADIDLSSAPLKRSRVYFNVIKIAVLSSTSLLIEDSPSLSMTPYISIDADNHTITVNAYGSTGNLTKIESIYGIGRISS